MSNWFIDKRQEDPNDERITTFLVHKKRGDIMSDCDLEMDDMLPFLNINPYGNIVVGGLGLGLIIDELLKLEKVDNIYVVEIDDEVIGLTSHKYDDNEKVTIAKGDARDFDLSQVPFDIDFVYMDIWDNDLGDTYEDRLEVCQHWGGICKECFSWAKDRSKINFEAKK